MFQEVGSGSSQVLCFILGCCLLGASRFPRAEASDDIPLLWSDDAALCYFYAEIVHYQTFHFFSP